MISGRYGYGKVIGHTQMSVFARYSKFKTIDIKNSPLKK
jgi:hypothetical protein